MITDADKQLFRASVEATTTIDKDKQSGNRLNHATFTDYHYVTEARLNGSDIIAHTNGVAPKIIKQMKRGTINHAPTLDLHGYTTIESCTAMSQFIYQHQHQTFIRIIHGKGYHADHNMSILKTQVVRFLHQHPQVLAFHSCPTKDGGTGAVFALLKT